MVQFDELRITKDGKNLIIRAHVNNLKFYDKLTVKKFYVYTEESIDDSGWANSSNAIYESDEFEEGTRSFEVSINCNETDVNFKEKDFSKNMLFVLVETEGDPECAPCGMNSNWTVGATFNIGLLYDKAMGYIKTLGEACEISNEFIDFILQFEGLKMAIEADNYNLAIKLFKKLFGSLAYNNVKGCGCHGKAGV